MQKNILIIDNCIEHCKQLKYGFLAAGYNAYYCLTSREGLIHLLKGHYCLVILETDLLEISGWEMLQIIRGKEEIAILIISNSNYLKDKIKAFSLGADDYMVKPIDLEEVIVRVEALCRRYDVPEQEPRKTSVLFCHSFTVDINYKTAYLDGRPLDLTRKEFELLYYLIVNKGRVLSKEQIYRFVWKEESFNSDNSVMCQVYNLRKKIEEDPTSPKYIQTVWGFGYRFLKD